MAQLDITPAAPPPKPPKGLGSDGRKLWRTITAEHELAFHEQLILAEACRQADRLQELAVALVGAPLTTTNARGDEVIDPRRVEARLLATALAKSLATLRIPEADDEDQGADRRRSGASRGSRAVYAARQS